MAGRYQGQHRLREGSHGRLIEVSWQQNGWFWRIISADRDAGDEAAGPFTTSTRAYNDACERFTKRQTPAGP
jgi:hypothetical protein